MVGDWKRYICMRQVLIRSIYSIEGSVRMPLARSASAADCLVYNLAARFTSFSSAVDRKTSQTNSRWLIVAWCTVVYQSRYSAQNHKPNLSELRVEILIVVIGSEV